MYVVVVRVIVDLPCAKSFDLPSAICRSDQFTCRIGGRCVSRAARCNGIMDCTDWSDEEGCKTPGKTVSSNSLYRMMRQRLLQ